LKLEHYISKIWNTNVSSNWEYGQW